MTDSNKINPDIKEVDYGKKELKKLVLYPLSIGDQFTVTDLITNIAQELIAAQKEGKTTDYAFMVAVMAVLKANISKVLSLIADIKEEEAVIMINDLTNSQLVDIVDIVWSVNFEPALKKGQSLFERGKKVFGSRQSLQDSSSSIRNTDLSMSTEKVTDKED